MTQKFNTGKTSIKGRVVADPEEVDTKNGQLVTFSVADNKRYLDRDANEWKDGGTTYYDVGVNREQLGANVMASVKQGQLVNVEGNHVVNAYTRTNGDAAIGHTIYATDVAPSLQLDTLERGPSAEVAREPEAAVETATPEQGPTTNEAGRKLQEEAAQSWAQFQQQAEQGQQAAGPGVN